MTAISSITAPAVPAYVAIAQADKHYENAEKGFASGLEPGPGLLEAGATRELTAAIELLKPHAGGGGFGGRGITTSIEHATSAVSMLEIGPDGYSTSSVKDILGEIRSARSALYQESIG